MTNEHHPFLPDTHSTCVHPLSDGRVCGGVPGQEVHDEEFSEDPCAAQRLFCEAIVEENSDPYFVARMMELFFAAVKERSTAEIDRLQRLEGK